MTEPTAMNANTDAELLQRYMRDSSAAAFEELVGRHLDHVFSAALRRVNGDRALAEDVAQTVFVDFARKAARIPTDMPPGGWLQRHTRFVASKMIDKERRRRAREQDAATMNASQLSAATDPEWSATAPLLDAAMDTLPSTDRVALVLRFFEGRDFRSVGEALGMSDDSAQKKVSRAVDKLRTILSRSGVVSSGGALASLMLANSVTAAPRSLAANISAHSLAGAATASTAAGSSLIGALSGLGAAARFKAGAALVAIVAMAGFAGSKMIRPESAPADDTSRAWERKATGEGAAVKNAAVNPTPSVAPVPLKLEELIAAAAAEWAGGRERVAGTAKALGFITLIDVEQMPEALALTAELRDEPARVLLSKNILAHWAELQPRAAMAWVQTEAATGERADLAQGVLMAWAMHNPDAVLGIAGKTGSHQFRNVPIDESAVATIFRSMANHDPRRAMMRLQALEPPKRALALRGILDTVQTDTDREQITALIAEIHNDETRIQAKRAMIEQWARRDAAAAADFVKKAEPSWERTRLMDSLGFTWLQCDPAPAADWWTEHVPGPDTLVKIINVWAQLDPNAAGEWLGKQPAGPTSDTARMTFSRQVADLDPESALRWAETVSDSEMRDDTIDRVFANWRSRNADAADAFLSNAGWPAERIERIGK